MTQQNKGYRQLALFKQIMLSIVVAICLPFLHLPAHSSTINTFTFHSDDPHLTNRVNIANSAPFSASVDTVQMLFNEISYNEPVLHVPLSRTFKAIAQKENVCVLNKRQSAERIEKYLFSLPLNFFQTQRSVYFIFNDMGYNV